MTPSASIKETPSEVHRKATGARSSTLIAIRLGKTRATVAEWTQGICSTSRRRCSSGVRRRLRPRSDTNLSSTWLDDANFRPRNSTEARKKRGSLRRKRTMDQPATARQPRQRIASAILRRRSPSARPLERPSEAPPRSCFRRYAGSSVRLKCRSPSKGSGPIGNSVSLFSSPGLQAGVTEEIDSTGRLNGLPSFRLQPSRDDGSNRVPEAR